MGRGATGDFVASERAAATAFAEMARTEGIAPSCTWADWATVAAQSTCAAPDVFPGRNDRRAAERVPSAPRGAMARHKKYTPPVIGRPTSHLSAGMATRSTPPATRGLMPALGETGSDRQPQRESARRPLGTFSSASASPTQRIQTASLDAAAIPRLTRCGTP